MDFKLLHSRRAIQSQTLSKILALISALLLFPSLCLAEDMPADFVFLKDVDPSILQDIRYAGKFNFIGAPAPGYKAAECVLHRRAAEALAKAQAQVKEKGFLLKVLDCYRPHKATQSFMGWVNSPEANDHPEDFYPDISKKSLVERKYISPNSTHSLGVAVDLTLVRPADSPVQTKARGGGPCNGPFDTRPFESSLDLGTTFDCFSDQSKTNYKGLSEQARENRNLLLKIMTSNGFGNYSREWWHYQLSPIPKDLAARNFDIPDRMPDGSEAR